MKKYALLWALCCAVCSLPTNAFAQKDTKRTDIAPLIGTYWMPAQHKGERGALGFKFYDETQISGSDGCNNFHTNYTYNPSKGFTLGSITSTELHCPNQKLFFDVHFLRQCQSYTLEGKKLTFYDKAGKEVIVLYSELVIDPNAKQNRREISLDGVLLSGDWKLESSTHPSFATLGARKIDLRLNIPALDKNLVASFVSQKNGKNAFNQFLSTYTIEEETNIKIALNDVFPMKKLGKKRPYCKELLEAFLLISKYEISGGKLITRSDSHTFTWTK